VITCKSVERSHSDPFHPHESSTSTTSEAASTATSNVIDTITLDETDRNRRRLLLNSDNGIEFLLELEAVTLLKQDDILRLNDGRGIRVQAKAEPLYEIRGNDTRHLLMLTWHVGNRHLASEIHSDHIRIRKDPVIRKMLEQLGANMTDVQAGFNPQGGAYDDASSTGHSHGHRHDHEHLTGRT